MSVIDVTDENFEKEVLKHDGKVVVDFNAGWCPPCQMLHPIFHELADKTHGIKFVSVDIDQTPIAAQAFGVSSIPCIIVFEKGKEQNRSFGFLPEKKLIKLIGE